jgi:hypothetical protein
MARQSPRSIPILAGLDDGRARKPRNVFEMFEEGSFTIILLRRVHQLRFLGPRPKMMSYVTGS